MKKPIVAVCVLALISVGCASSKTPGPGSTNASSCTTRIASPAKLSFVQPAPDQSVPKGHVVVELKLTGGTVVAPGTTCDVKPNEGHVHILLDGKTITIAAGLTVVVNDQPAGANGAKLGPLTPGLHVLQAKFVDSAHIPFNPEVNAGPITFRAA